MPDQVPPFLNELNRLLGNAGALFVCPLTLYICSISLDSKGANSHWQKFWFHLASPPLQDRDLLIVFFTLRIRRQSFLLVNLTIARSLSFRRWQAWMWRLHISTPISWNTPQTFCSRTLSLTDIVIQTTSSVSLLEYWAFSQHRCSVATTLSTNLLFTFLAITTSASNFLECLWLQKQVFDFSSQFSNLWSQVSFSI